jgi:antitoxin component YwqK of YwqJK toxin-antitoxin module
MSLSSLAQKRYVYYFDDKLKYTQKSKSVYTGYGVMDNDLLRLQILDNKTNQKIVHAYYTDSSLAVSQGLYLTYSKNGIKEIEGNYDNNLEEGVWKKWNEARQLLDSSVYSKGRKVITASFKYDEKGNQNYHGVTDFKNDKKQVFVYNDSGKLIREINFIGQNGIIKIFNGDGIKIDSVFSREEIDASFPGGDSAWSKFLLKMLTDNINDLTSDGASGTCRVRFIIDKEGNLQDVKALTMIGSSLAEIAIRTIKKGPKWIPASQYGRPVNAYRELPITFTIQ